VGLTRRRAHDWFAGFTVVELIVVVAVTALLLAMLVPSLASVRAAGRSAACLSNLRQMAIAAQRYALEYKYFPPAIRFDLDGGVVNLAWDWVTTWDGRLLSPGPLWSFTDDPGRVQQCPVYHGPTNFDGDPHTGYNYNTTYVGGEGPFMSWGWDDFRPGVRYGACRWTSRVAVFGDGGVVGGVANKFMRAPMNEVEQTGLGVIYGGGQAFRHVRATNVAYLDLHVAPAAAPHRGARADDALIELLDYPENGFLSDDDTAYDPNP